MTRYILPFSAIGMDAVGKVGGKNASLGEMFQNLKNKGIHVPDGFAVTADAYWELLDQNELREPLKKILDQLDTIHFDNLQDVGSQARALLLQAQIPEQIASEILYAFRKLGASCGRIIQVAVRSSATAEDLPSASFAGQQESFLNISTEVELLEACRQCYISLFTDRAIKYREDRGFEHMKVALSIGVQVMVRSDMASSGVIFTLEPETGFKDVILITGSWGLGENVVKGNVNPDEFYVFKPSLQKGLRSIITKKVGEKAKTMVYAKEHEALIGTTVNLDTPMEKQEILVLNDAEIETLARWSFLIEDHYKLPMDIEWAKDGISGELFIVQARPETVHARAVEPYKLHLYELKEKGKVLAKGIGLGNRITAGKARKLSSPLESDKLQAGEVLITDITNPDWDPLMKKAAAIITNKGGRTSHAAIVARELGAVAVVGTGNATETIEDGQEVTVVCTEGNNGLIYAGKLQWSEQEIDLRNIQMPETEVMLIAGDPDKAFRLSFLPNNGIGLMRIEFIINNVIGIHPMALRRFDELKDPEAKEKIQHLTRGYANKSDFFVERLAQGVATLAAAFYPKDVIVRMSDFKTNEYANLLGGKEFEPTEENPMLGFRGASRYYHELYRDGFELECRAMKMVRDEMGLDNAKLMIPFCRTVEEGEKVVEIMERFGLKRGENGLEIYVMVEIPSNVILAEAFAEVFDGFSIGSNDLTQLTLGLDRDSVIVSNLFDERNLAVKTLIAQAIRAARKAGIKIGLCGQAPSDLPEFAQFLVEQGISNISFNPDALLKGIENINLAEKKTLEKV
ncbi:MAG: phosphoenolpyruvate synthase [Saprospiraceae bacterium]|nr:phosphoenolpyruvate synthase [Saprospiraceae bacterium]